MHRPWMTVCVGWKGCWRKVVRHKLLATEGHHERDNDSGCWRDQAERRPC